MSEVRIAKLFRNGGSQAIRLPQEFRFQGDRVRIRRLGTGVLVEPIVTPLDEWFAEIDAPAAGPFMPDGRNQPSTPVDDPFA